MHRDSPGRGYVDKLRKEHHMKIYKITLRSQWGEPFIVTVAGSSLYEAMKQVTLDPGWIFGSYSVLGVTA